MTVREIFESVRDAASALYDGREAAAIARLVAEAKAGITRTGLILAPEREADVPEDWQQVLEQVRTGRPVQYILGRAEFCGLDLAVQEGVLIPRSETEELVEWIADAEKSACTILDIGTGSGAIAVVLATRLPGARVRATDVSPEALEIAAGNARTNAVRVEFLRADILAGRDEWDGQWEPGSFDVIVSNPPYIPLSDLASIHRNVKGYEPHIALFVPDDDPLVFYRAIAENALWLLRGGGALYFEIYENFAPQMKELLTRIGFGEVEVRADMNGKNRMLRCVRR